MDEEGKLVPRPRQPLSPLEAVPAPPHYPPWAQPLPSLAPHLRDYLLTLRKHPWVILSFLLTVVTVTTIASFRLRPVYVAVARVEIDKENPYILPFPSTTPQEWYWDTESYLETRAKIVQSETLALQTIKALELDKHPEFASVTPKPAASPGASPATPASQEKPPILGAFLGHLRVSMVRNSRLLEVQFEAHDPRLAAQVVNTHLANFIEHNFRTRYESMVQASSWLATQLDELKIKVEKSEDALVAYERENQIWAIDEKQSVTTQKLSDLNRQLTEAQADRMQKESNNLLAPGGNLDAIPAVRDSQVIQTLVQKRADLSGQYSEALAQFGPDYPKVVRLRAHLEELDSSLEREKQNIVAGIESEYRAAKHREALLSQALERQKAEANELAQKLVQYNILKREAEANKQLYDGLLQRIKEAGIAAGLRSTNIRVVDPALIPAAPVRPRKLLNILFSLVVGLLGGIGLAFFREYLDNTVKTPDDITYLTRLPSLAVVPELASVNGRVSSGRLPKLLKSASQAVSEPPVELISHERPRSQVSEAFRTLRTSLLLSQADSPPQVILVTSALPQEGKTTAALNLAVTLAQLGDRTLLLDADLRKPGIGKLLNLSHRNDTGLVGYLTGNCSLEEVTGAAAMIANLTAIPAGPIPPNPAELLSSERLREALGALRRHYKFIIMDSPPLLTVTDPVILSALADCVVLVVRSGETPKQALTRARELLAGVKCRLLGVVLNAVDFAAPYYYYSYYKYYPYREEPSPPSES